MKMRNKIISFGLALLLLMGCSKDWLDINQDPNNPTDAPAELVLSAAQLEVGSVIGGYYNLLGGFWSQYWTQSNAANQYKYIDGYLITADDFTQQWGELYAGALNDIKFAKKKAVANEQWDVYLMLVSMEVYAYQALVDLYDDVPFTEALNGDIGNYSPKYDKGSAIYPALISMLDDALAKDIPASSTLSNPSQDLMFKGSVSKWIQFANTLKLKLYMRQMYVKPDVAEAGVKAIFSSGAALLSDHAALDIFIDEKYKQNPLYSSNNENLNVKTNLRLSATLAKYLEANLDPRYDVFNGGAPAGGKGTPLPQGGFNIISTKVDPTTVSVFKISPVAPVYFFTEAEVHFLVAEAAAKGWISEDDKAHYEAGVKAAFEMYELDATPFLADDGAYKYPASGTFEQKQEAIMMQKWVSMAGIQGLESFLETNRTQYPAISTVPAGDANGLNPSYNGGKLTYSLGGTTGGKFPRRLLVPQTERVSNVNIPAELKDKKVYDKVWWDTK